MNGEDHKSNYRYQDKENEYTKLRSSPPLYNLSEAAHIDKIELHQMANLAIKMIRIPGISKKKQQVNILTKTIRNATEK